MKYHLIVYAKCPIPNHAKTRLGRVIGEEAAAGVYARLLYAYILELLAHNIRNMHVELAVTASDEIPFFAAAFPELTVRSQTMGDLGRRMAASFARAFAEGAEAVVLTGSDIPGLGTEQVREAFKKLESARAVIGPARDGGYYLIGMRAPGADLFQDIAWSTNRVLEQTEALAQVQGLTMARLPILADLDTAEDYKSWSSLVVQ